MTPLGCAIIIVYNKAIVSIYMQDEKGFKIMTLLRDISFLLSMFHVIILFLLLFEPKYSWKTTMVISFGGCMAIMIANALLMIWKGPAIIMSVAFFTCTIPSAIIFLALSRHCGGRFFFLFCLTDTLSFWILQITNFLDRLTGDTYVVMFISRLVLFPLVEWFIWQYLRIPYIELQRNLNKGWWLFAAIGGTYYLLIMVTSIPVGTPMPDRVGLIRIMLVLILMPLTYLTILRSLWRQMVENRTRTEMAVLSTRSQLALENLRIVQESGAALIQARHDMLGNLSVLQSLSWKKDYDGLDRYLALLTRQTEKIVPIKIANHPIVNAILAQGAERAQTSDIDFRCKVTIPETVSILDEDLAAYLINLVRNALEAVELLAHGQQKWVEITIHIRGKYLFIECKNPYSHAPDPDGDSGRYISRKGDGHGYGLWIMEKVARRYQSELYTEAKDGVFLARTALLMPESK